MGTASENGLGLAVNVSEDAGSRRLHRASTFSGSRTIRPDAAGSASASWTVNLIQEPQTYDTPPTSPLPPGEVHPPLSTPISPTAVSAATVLFRPPLSGELR